MKNEEKTKPENKNTAFELNEAAEYIGNKQAEEDLLLSAQRYLNIFHQIHIFNDRKKNEFDQSLLDMPIDVRHILAILPGGRVLLEHIGDLQKDRNINDTDLQYLLEQVPNHFSELAKGPAATPQQILSNLADTINNALNAYNDNVKKLSEEMQKQTTSQQATSQQNIQSLVEALRTSNQQQVNMMKAFGESISKAIIQSQKEIASSLEKSASASRTTKITAVPKSALTPERKAPTLVKVKKAPASQPTRPTLVIKPEPEEIQQEKKAISSADLLKQSVNQNLGKKSQNEVVDIDLNSLLDTAQPTGAAPSQKATQTATVNLPQGSSAHVYDSAMEKIKSALNSSPNTTISSPVSLEKDETKISDSFYKNTSNDTTDDSEEWVYVDENGNPVDENGNPLDDTEWEYVDENGNPIDDGEWEYVDENGNPIK